MQGDDGRSSRVLGGSFAALRHRDFGLFWSAAAVSSIGTRMQLVTVPFVLDQLTHSSTWVGVGAFATFFPVVVFGPLSGSLADRFSKRTVLLSSQSVMLVGALALWLVWLSGSARPGVILACVLVVAVGNGVNQAPWHAFIVELVPAERMLDAVRLNSLQVTVASAIGPAVAGVLLAAFGAATAFLVNALSFAVVIGALLAIRGGGTVHAQDAGSVIAHFREGLAFVLGRRALSLTMLAALTYGLFGSGVMQMVEPISRHVLNVGPAGFGVLVASYGIGALAGSLVVVRIGDVPRRSRMALVGLILFGASEILLGLAPGYAVGLVALVLMGVNHILVTVPLTTSVQATVDDQFRGRAMSIFFMAMVAGLSVGAIVAGVLADQVGLRPTIIGAGVAMICFALFAITSLDSLRPLDEPLATRR